MPQNPEQHFSADVAGGQMRADLRADPAQETSANKGDSFYALTICTVTRVDYAKMEINLRTQQGETTHRIAGPILFPGAGNRHFFGAMPEPGDLCVVGWSPQESGYTKRPFIVGWLVPGTTAGYDWLPTQPYGPDEFGASPKNQHQLSGIASRVRHKLQTLNPGNIAASSSQGSDLVLDESVSLANRRGNEVRLRDQDQAFIVRSLQQFHAGAGFRTYSGMVQRDARYLPTQMFATGTDWTAARQVDAEGNALASGELGDSPYPSGLLTPAEVFQRADDGTPLSSQSFSSDVDPYEFLQRGLFISANGFVRGGASPALYGGKPIYRVSTEATNSADDTSVNTLTEFRIEVAHIADGTLPVTEQTDGFDADRLPSGNPEDADPNGASSNAPFIECVMGSVVGNDPYTDKGLEVYGLPLRASIFEGDVRSPSMVSALGSPIETHAATLFSVRPPLSPNTSPTFWSIAKDGRVQASIVGPGDNWSMEAAFLSGLRMGSGSHPNGRSIQADLDGGLYVRSKRGDSAGNVGIDLSSDLGAVRLFAGGSTSVGGIAAQNAPSGEGSGGLPGLILESATNALLKASKTLTISATRLDLTNVQELNLNANSGLNFQSGGTISHSSATYAQASMGKSEFTYSGPKGANPANGAVRDTKIIANPATGFPGGPADTYLLLYGDRLENLLAGNHFTNVAVGNQFYNVGTGSIVATAVGNSMSLSPAGASLIAATGTALVASSGATAITAAAAVTLQGATVAVIAGSVAFTSPAGLHSIPPQIPGAMLTDGCLNPLTGLPFSATGTLGIQTLRVF